MNNPQKPIGFAPPPIDEDSLKAVERVLRSGWITSGPELQKFEDELRSFTKAHTVICFSSWTTACELALRWFGIGPGDEVIIPAMTYAATANIVLHTGATPIMVDVDPIERVVTPELMAAAIGPKTKVVMPVDLGGWPVDYTAIFDWLKGTHVKNMFRANNEKQALLGRPLFLADAAHSFGAKIDQEPLGTQADIIGFSFHAVKNLTTAEGGALAFNLPDGFSHENEAKWFRAMSLHGQSKSAFEKTTSESWQYDVAEAGFKCNMTDIQAALGRAQLKKYASQLLRRKAIANAYLLSFNSERWFMAPPLINDNRESSYHIFSMRIDGFKAEQRDELMRQLRSIGIATNVHFIPLPNLTLHRKRGESIDRYPHTQSLFENCLSLPIHLALSDDEVQWICHETKRLIQSIFNRKSE